MEDFTFSRDKEITLIIVYDDEDKEYADYLFDLISSKENIIAARWTVKEYEQSKASVSSKNYTVLIGNNKLTQSKREFIPKMAFNENGMSYGWLGKSAILYLNNVDIFKEYLESIKKIILNTKSHSNYIDLLKNPFGKKNLMLYNTYFIKTKKQRYINLIDTFYRNDLERFLERKIG